MSNTEITVTVPTERVADFYRWYADWSEGKVGVGEADSYPVNQTVEAAAAWWATLNQRERQIQSLWIQASPRTVSGEDIVEALGLERQGQIRGVLSWMTRKGENAHFTPKWTFTVDPITKQGHYGIINKAFADLVGRGRDRAESRS